MKFYDIAYKNIKGNMYRYIMYYLSNVFSVMLFFTFANFIFHPAVISLKAAGSMMLYSISRGLVACEYVIIVFSFFFVNYSNSTFIKSRGKEFGLLSMFGMTKGQIRKFVAYENVIVSSISIVSGIALGGLFSKLFFMAVEAVIDNGSVIPFIIAPKAVLITGVSYFVLFQAISLLSLRKINSKTIITQLKSARAPKPIPKFSKPLAILGVVMILAGYALAWISNVTIVITMFPVLGLTVTGTYFLFTQFSVAAMRKLQQNKNIFYKKTNMIAISQVIYKLKDNARVLFLISILGAVTLTAAGTLFALFNTSQKQILEMVPQHVSIIERGMNSHNVISRDKLMDILNKHSVKINADYTMKLVYGTWKLADKDQGGKMLAMSASDYNIRAKALNMKTLSLKGNDIAVIKLWRWLKDPRLISCNINGEIENSRIKDSFYGRPISTSVYDYVAVFSDDEFQSIVKATPPDELRVYYGYDIDGWKNANNAIEEIRSNIPEDYENSIYEGITSYASMMKTQAMVTLIGMFVALLFLIATGSIIYFKLFTEMQRDREEFISLMKMGLSKSEMRKIINSQMFVIFFLPFAVAASHSSFALKTLSDILKSNLISEGLTVIFAYLIFQTLYFFLIKFLYRSRISTIG